MFNVVKHCASDAKDEIKEIGIKLNLSRKLALLYYLLKFYYFCCYHICSAYHTLVSRGL
jgi:hypothetical protein